jgi:hypothetical protein
MPIKKVRNLLRKNYREGDTIKTDGCHRVLSACSRKKSLPCELMMAAMEISKFISALSERLLTDSGNIFFSDKKSPRQIKMKNDL